MIEKPVMRRCPFCQANIQEDARVCTNCGRDLSYTPVSVDMAPTQPTRINNPYGQPAQQYGQPPDNDQSSNWPPTYQPPAPIVKQRPSWPLLIAGVSLLLVIVCGLTVIALIITSNNGATGLGAQVSTQIGQAFGGAGSANPEPTATALNPAPEPTLTPVAIESAQPTPTLNPTQASITNKLLSAECKGALDRLSKVSDSIKNDPLKVLDDTWRKEMDQATADLKTYCGSLDSASPVPGEIGQVQKSMNQANSEFDQAKLLWNQAIDQRDPGKAVSAAQHIGEATKYLSQAISQLQKLVP
jgi:hypothetical protein